MPDTENGRYALAPVADGRPRFGYPHRRRLDLQQHGAGWACYACPTTRSAPTGIGRLQADMRSSKDRMARASRPVLPVTIDEPAARKADFA